MIDINQTYERPLLSKLALKYENRDFIGSQIFPWVRVPKDRVSYAKFDRAVTFKRPNTVYGPRSKANELELKVTKQTHDLKSRGLGAWIDEDERTLAGDIGNARALKTQALKNGLMLDLEVEIATAMTTAGSYAASNKTTLVGTAQWSDPASKPKSDVLTAHSAMVKKGNTMIVGQQVHNALLTNAEIKDAVKYTQGAVDVSNVLARYFNVERYFVGEAFQDTAADGQAESLGYIWGKFAWIGYINYKLESAMDLISKPSFGYLPISAERGDLWKAYSVPPDPRVGSGEGMEYVKVDGKYEPLYCAYDLGYLISEAVA